MSKRMVNIGFTVVVFMVAVQLVLAVVDAGALNRRALDDSAGWNTQAPASSQASVDRNAGDQTVVGHPDAGETATAGTVEQPGPWLGWVVIAFLAAMLLALRSTLRHGPKERDAAARG
jgi:hypothetical protein